MASGPIPAILLFPTGVDIYSSKIDRNVIVSGESHAVPAVAPYEYFLNFVPKVNTPTFTSIPGFTEVTGTPIANQFQVTYSGSNQGLLTFNGVNAGNATPTTYTAFGSTVTSEFFNSLQTSVVGIENFIISGLGISGSFLSLTGGTLTGDLVMNGGDILTILSGVNSIGTVGTPFSSIVGDALITDRLRSFNGNDEITLGSSITVSGDTSVTIKSDTISSESQSDNTVSSANTNVNLTASAGIVKITANEARFTAHANPNADNLYSLGTSGNRWKNFYVHNIFSSGLDDRYVRTVGGTIAGSLIVEGSIITNSILAPTGALALSAPGAITILGNPVNITSNTDTIFAFPAGLTLNLGNVLKLNTSLSTLNSSLVPVISGNINLGAQDKPYGTVYADNIVGLNLSGNFVNRAGDRMDGDLAMGVAGISGGAHYLRTNFISPLIGSGILTMDVGELNIKANSHMRIAVGATGNTAMLFGLSAISFSKDFLPTASGTYDVGSPSNPLDWLYADNISVQSIGPGTAINGAIISGSSVLGSLTFGTGSTVVSLPSGTVDIGTIGNPFGTLYANNIVTAETTGSFISKFGDTMIGNLAFGTGSNVTMDGSGVSNFGSVAFPIGSLWADSINSTGLDGKYVKKAGDSMFGPLSVDTITSTGTLNITGLNFINIRANQIDQRAEQVNITSLNGPVIIDANTELQLGADGNAWLVINTTGNEFRANLFPDFSGTHTVGTLERPFAAIYADQFVATATSGTGNFILKIGDSMLGNLNFISGANQTFSDSGVNTIGTLASPLGTLYVDNTPGLDAKYVLTAGDTMTGDLLFSSDFILGSDGIGDHTLTLNPSSGTIINGNALGVSINGDSGQITLLGGTEGVLIAGGSDSVNINGDSGGVWLNGGGGGVHISGDSGNIELHSFNGVVISGNLGITLDTRTDSAGINLIANGGGGAGNVRVSGDVVPWISGNFSLGASDIPFGDLYVQTINGVVATSGIFNEIPSGSINGINATFTLAFSPLFNSQRVFRAGLRMTPDGVDYLMTGTTITFLTPPSSGDNIVVDYEKPLY